MFCYNLGGMFVEVTISPTTSLLLHQDLPTNWISVKKLFKIEQSIHRKKVRNMFLSDQKKNPFSKIY